MKNRAVVVDTGPLVALLDRREKHHSWAARQLQTLPLPWIRSGFDNRQRRRNISKIVGVAGDDPLKTHREGRNQHIGHRTFCLSALAAKPLMAMPKLMREFGVGVSPRFGAGDEHTVKKRPSRPRVTTEARPDFDKADRTDDQPIDKTRLDACRRARFENGITRMNVQDHGGIDDPSHLTILGLPNFVERLRGGFPRRFGSGVAGGRHQGAVFIQTRSLFRCRRFFFGHFHTNAPPGRKSHQQVADGLLSVISCVNGCRESCHGAKLPPETPGASLQSCG